jgi:hypothetical protein
MLFLAVECRYTVAPDQAVARMTAVALMFRNFANVPLGDRIATLLQA